MRILFGVFGALVLAGCQMQAPSGTTDSTAEPAATQTLQTSPPVSLLTAAKSRSGTQSGSILLTAIENAMLRDPSLAAARLSADLRDAEAVRTGAWFRPEVSTTAQQLSGSDFSAALTISQPIYDFGKRAASRAAVQTQAGRDRLAVDEIRNTVALDLLSAAVLANEARQRIAVNTRRIAAFRDALKMAEQMAALELLSASDTQLAEVRLKEAQKDKRTAEIALQQAQSQWARLATGTALPPETAIAKDILRRFGLTSEAAALSQTRLHNIDVRVAEVEKQVLESQLRASEKGLLPTVNAVSSTALTKPTDGSRRTNIGLTFDFDIYSRADRDALITTRDRIAVQDAQAAELRRTLEFDVRDAWQRIGDAQEIARLERSSIGDLKARAANLEDQLETGFIPFTDVVRAKTELYETELAAIANQFAAERAAVQILVLSGVVSGRAP